MTDEYQLSPEERAVIAEYQAQLNALRAQLGSMIGLIIRQQKLTGAWTLDDQGTKLMRAPVPQAVGEQ